MGYRELFLVLVSVVLLTTLMVQINSNTVEGREALQELEIAHTAASVAQRFIEEGKSKLFDAQIGMIDPADMPDDFTPYSSLGHGWWEDYPNFNDVDDYHNFVDTVYVAGVDYRVSITVRYVNDNAPETTVNAETFFKRMTVTVTSSWLPNANIVLKQIYSYYGMN